MSETPTLTMTHLIRDAIERLNLWELDWAVVYPLMLDLLRENPVYDVPHDRDAFMLALARELGTRPFVVSTTWDDVPGSGGRYRQS